MRNACVRSQQQIRSKNRAIDVVYDELTHRNSAF